MPSAGSIMNDAAVLLNDAARTNFTYTVQVPYINMALNELQEELELNNIPSTNETSAIIPITTLQTDIGGATGPALPTDLIEIQQLWERKTGTTSDFIPMFKYEFLPKTSVKGSNLGIWSWQKQIINFLGATNNTDVMIDYVGSVQGAVADENTSIVFINSKSFLTYRTAALVARFVGENPTRADELDAFCILARDRAVGISVKGKQAIATRRRPFRASRKF